MGAQRGPLSGLTVIEIASFVAGPLAGMTLGQLGAQVIRVDPIGGAADRGRWPVADSGASLYWNGLNKGKRSLTADVRGAQGREIVHRLIGSSAPGTAVVLTNIGGQPWLDADALRSLCPDLIYVAIEGKSDGSPSVDYTTNAAMGFPLVTGPAGLTEPINHVLPAWDVACGLYAALGVSTAARQRELTGEGADIRIALDDVALATAGNLGYLAEAQFNHTPRPRIGNHLYGGFARDFRCSDGASIMIVALTSRHWRDLVRVTGVQAAVEALESAFAADFTNEADRYTHRVVLAALLEPWFETRSRSEAESALTTTSCLWAPYRSFPDVVESLQTTEGGNPIVTVVDQPGVGRQLTPGSPLRFGTVTDPALPAPLLGQHTWDVLHEGLGIDRAEYERLVASGVIAEATASE